MSLNIDVTVRGPLFEKKVDETVRRAIAEEGLDKIAERLTRKGAQGSGGKGVGVKRNAVTQQRRASELTVDTLSTRVFPRTRGTSWLKKNSGIARAMAPRVLRKVAQRIVGELG